MALNPQQVFANFVLTKLVPALGSHASASNLEWNAKKFLGQVPGESLDAATYAERTLADLQAASAAQPGNADLSGAVATLGERFGISTGGSVAAASAPAGGSGHSAHAASAESGASLAQVAAGAQAAAASGDFDINQFLSDKAESSDDELAWDTSVVDLLKLLGRDSSVSARRKYMAELGLDESTAGTAEGNTELHSALLGQLASTGGQWPANLA